MRHLQGHAALTGRMVFHRIDDVPHLVDVADHGKHDALRSHVQGARDVVVFLRRHADDCRKVGRLEIAERALHRLEAEARMFEVEENEVAARGLQDMADARRGELDDEVPEFRRARARHLL